MNYRINPKNGDKLSALGFGCMRFAKDENEVEKQIIYAIENGVNYFDTAYSYPNSEAILGRILSKGYRDKVKIATKIPPYRVSKHEDLDKIFNAELERLQTDYIDYYLVHTLLDVKAWNRLLSFGMLEWVKEKKENGQIKNFGFSFHGGVDDYIALVDIFDWDFCMLQYNYFDENNQAGKSGLAYAAEKGLPVIVMEPLRGGTLTVRLPKEAADVWNNAYIRRSLAEWGLRWVWNHPQVITVLSGMNTQEMVEENIRVASEAEPNTLTEQDMRLYEQAKKAIMNKTKVPCTGCNYCMPCPNGVDIPLCFFMYNESALSNKLMAKFRYVIYVRGHKASCCTQCGKCEQRCPQKIAIRNELAATSKMMERGLYKPLRFLAKNILKIK